METGRKLPFKSMTVKNSRQPAKRVKIRLANQLLGRLHSPNFVKKDSVANMTFMPNRYDTPPIVGRNERRYPNRRVSPNSVKPHQFRLDRLFCMIILTMNPENTFSAIVGIVYHIRRIFRQIYKPLLGSRTESEFLHS